MKISEIIMKDIEKTRGIKFEKEIDIENLSDKELRATRFVDGWTEDEIERIEKEWAKRGL
ncbi:MAG: hypothetical protein E6510_01680 [Gemella haemolysans]|uniref:hypothetical protein n=1 Tax=Gemella haemolysans TaxID=1379 RepID=UPI00290B3042|nr:hypothetical protein [Gemella haemolysans]MDU6572902.1 hypothetical protein [Gemella haemolysans]